MSRCQGRPTPQPCPQFSVKVSCKTGILCMMFMQQNLHKERLRSYDCVASVSNDCKLSSVDDLDAPLEYLCPITNELMQDPVIVVQTGITYERSAIEKWLSIKNTCPSTQTILHNKTLVPNLFAKTICSNYQENVKRLQQQPASSNSRQQVCKVPSWQNLLDEVYNNEYKNARTTWLGQQNFTQTNSHRLVTLGQFETYVKNGNVRNISLELTDSMRSRMNKTRLTFTIQKNKTLIISNVEVSNVFSGCTYLCVYVKKGCDIEIQDCIFDGVGLMIRSDTPESKDKYQMGSIIMNNVTIQNAPEHGIASLYIKKIRFLNVNISDCQGCGMAFHQVDGCIINSEIRDCAEHGIRLTNSKVGREQVAFHNIKGKNVK
eukprot:TRINITY_DN7389_c0_g1_i1.p1 TRINITY_DN7389_c0_g1~~TRINITY_DN7389_c0_g1_i1.p1  ORF type:complete len:375 (-),score=-9.84 TRINITY_DN7389_c0_g1_i1:960-2084(-)